MKLTSPERISIYAVDDDDDLIELYATFLRGAGYAMRAFNDRAAALASLKEETVKPQLLVTDYLGGSIPVESFMRCCVAVHPRLRVLVASGFTQTEARFAGAKPDRFIQKPFTAAEFLREVRIALALRAVRSVEE